MYFWWWIQLSSLKLGQRSFQNQTRKIRVYCVASFELLELLFEVSSWSGIVAGFLLDPTFGMGSAEKAELQNPCWANSAPAVVPICEVEVMKDGGPRSERW